MQTSDWSKRGAMRRKGGSVKRRSLGTACARLATALLAASLFGCGGPSRDQIGMWYSEDGGLIVIEDVGAGASFCSTSRFVQEFTLLPPKTHILHACGVGTFDDNGALALPSGDIAIVAPDTDELLVGPMRLQRVVGEPSGEVHELWLEHESRRGGEVTR